MEHLSAVHGYGNDCVGVGISALIVTYNQAKYIEKAIEGALMQVVEVGYEIIIADDVSTDGTYEIAKTYSENYPHISVIQTRRNSGPFENVINGLRSCRGQYIATCEGDDYWVDKMKLQMQYKYMSRHTEAAMVYTRFKVVNDNDIVISTTSGNSKGYSHGMILAGGMPHSLTVMFRRECLNIETLKVMPKTRYLDRLIFALITENGYCAFLDKYTAAYRVTQNGIYYGASPNDKLRNDLEMYQVLALRYTDLRRSLWIRAGVVRALLKYIGVITYSEIVAIDKRVNVYIAYLLYAIIRTAAFAKRSIKNNCKRL